MEIADVDHSGGISKLEWEGFFSISQSFHNHCPTLISSHVHSAERNKRGAVSPEVRHRLRESARAEKLFESGEHGKLSDSQGSDSRRYWIVLLRDGDYCA